MKRLRTYLDHNASSPMRPEARAAMLGALDLVGNASSVHAEGRAARAAIERSRVQVAALVGAKPDEVYFTSGATESNNWVLAGGWDEIILWPGLEHDSVSAPLAANRQHPCGTDKLHQQPVTTEGMASLVGLRTLESRQQTKRGLATLQLANNETGVLQPVAELARLAKPCGCAVHTDAVQAAGRIAIDFATLGTDFLSLSSHKLGGPKGIGALVVRDGASLPPLIKGGGQERRQRAGTENVAAIAGFGAAAEAARQGLAQVGEIRALRDRLEHEVLASSPHALVIGHKAERLANTTCLALPGAKAETLLIALDLAGIAVSAGAACSSGKVSRSHVLAAMGVPDELAGGAIRISLGWNTTNADIDAFLTAWSHITAAQSARRSRVA